MQYSESENGSILANIDTKSEVNCTSDSEILDKSIIKNTEQEFELVPSLLEELNHDILAKYEKEQETVYLYKLSKCSKPTESLLICTFCEKTFTSQGGISLHYIVVHRMYRCEQCSKIFSHDDYRMHILVHQPTKQYSCHQCKRRFAKKYSLERHANKHQGLASFICHLCNAGFQTRPGVDHHVKRKHKDSYSEEKGDFERGLFRQCDICKKYFQILAEFERHYLSHRNTVKYVCHTCKCEFSCKENLMQHKDIEHNSDFIALNSSKSFFCTICHFGFVRKEYLVMHMWGHQSQTVHICEECGVTFETDSELQTHYLEHVTEYYMTYDVVKSYSSVELHSDDEEMHDLPFNYKLSEEHTDKTASSSKDGLGLHQERTCSNISYDCSNCDKSYTRKHMLIAHERHKHGKVIPYDCRFCKKAFTFLSSLRYHRCMHTSKKTTSN